MSLYSFEVIPGTRESFVILHVPHSSRYIPEDALNDLLISGPELEQELDEITDTLTDEIALDAVAQLPRDFPKPWLFINRTSRFVIDPERFPDDREIMNQVGMGAVYTKTTSGAQLRQPGFNSQPLLDKYFHPYSKALADLVGARLETTKKAVIIDVHSYRANQHPNAVNHGQRRPAMCIGTDEFHTPGWLAEIFRESFAILGDCYENQPYAGTYVPLDFYRREPNVLSVMMETRANTFLNENLQPHEGFAKASAALARVVTEIQAKISSELAL